MSKEKKIGFNLSGIETEQFAVFEENYRDNEDIELKTNLSFTLNKDERVFIVTNKFTFDILEKPFLSIQVSCYFALAEDALASFETKSKFVFPKGFVAHMAMLTVGTTRGILHSETAGTDFNKYFLPTINVSEMVNEDVVFDM